MRGFGSRITGKALGVMEDWQARGSDHDVAGLGP
jgi:hypothetical protein